MDKGIKGFYRISGIALNKRSLAVALVMFFVVSHGLIFFMGLLQGYDLGVDDTLRNVMRAKNSAEFERLSPDVKRALSQMERVKISTRDRQIAGCGANTRSDGKARHDMR